MKKRVVKFLRKYYRWRARKNLKKNEHLWREIKLYLEKTKSTGVSWSDFWELYNAVTTKKPLSILECGPGASTLVMAFALMENEKKGFPRGKITAMEEMEEYYEMSIKLLPEYLHQYVDYILSPRIDDYYEIYRGVRYRDVPNIQYDFVFVDGPHHHSPTNDEFCFDFDFIHVLKNATIPVNGMIDYRLSSTYVLQKLFGSDVVKFNYLKEIGIIENCTKDHLKTLSLKENTRALNEYGRIFGNTKVDLYN